MNKTSNSRLILAVLFSLLSVVVLESVTIGDLLVAPKVTGLADNALTVLNKTCFVAGTLILTPDGAKPIEQFKPGDPILSRPEDQPDAPVGTRVVEKLFELAAPILDLRVGGQTIETTAEHPFYVVGKGWIRAEKLESGDVLVGHDGGLTPVDSVTLTNRHETVYNVRVAEDHTYFVGDTDWGFSVWVHNAYSVRQVADGTWEIIDGAGDVVRRGLSKSDADDLARLFNASRAIPQTLKDVNLKGIIQGFGKNLADEGKFFGWRPGSIARPASSFTKSELLKQGWTRARLEQVAEAYEHIARITPANPSAAGRAAQLREILENLF